MINVFKRDCVTCPATAPSCNCPNGEACAYSLLTCEKCPEARCIATEPVTKSNTGAIAGGVVGGLFGLAVIVGALVWYKFRNQRQRNLEYVKEADYDFESPPDSSTRSSSEEFEERPPSMTSTYGMASRRSNVIPIMLPLNGNESIRTGRNSVYSQSSLPIRFTNNFSSSTAPVIRDSIGFSEYSIDSDSASVNTHGLRSYDVAVQGMPNLVDISKMRPNLTYGAPLGAISENDTYGEEESPGESQHPPPGNQRSPQRKASSNPRRSMITVKSVDSALPALPESDTVSCFDDSQAITHTNRQSVASSQFNEFSIPEEARIYLNRDSMQ